MIPTINAQQVETMTEFAVVVQGVGNVCIANPVTFSVTDNEMPTVFLDYEEALGHARRLATQYSTLGAADLVDKVHVVARTLTLTREPWREPKRINVVSDNSHYFT